MSGALAAPLRRIDGGLYIDVLARIIVVGLSMKLTSAVLQQRVSSVLCHSWRQGEDPNAVFAILGYTSLGMKRRHSTSGKQEPASAGDRAI